MHFAIFVFLMILNNILYIKIYFAVKMRNNVDLGLNSSSFEVSIHHRQVAKMLIVNGVFFFLCISLQIFAFPVNLIFRYLINNYDPTVLFFVWGFVSDIVLGLNACMNPVLYLITNMRYRHAFTTVFTWSRNNVQNKTEVNTIEMSNINQ